MADEPGTELQEALDGRLPVLPRERVYNTYGSLLWTTAVLSAASYAYLIGSAFQSFGNTKLAITGYLIGLIVGEVVVLLAVGIPAWRYGVDTIDVAKAPLGIRGSVLLLITVLSTCLGWAYVLLAMSARGLAGLGQPAGPGPTGVDERVVVVVALVLLFVVWYLARRGPSAMERLSRICGPVQIIVGLIILAMLIAKYGAAISEARGATADVITRDPLTQIAFGVEFGFDNALSLLPFLGGLTRLVRHKRHLVGPTVVGSGIVGASLIATVAALAGAVFADTDPVVWIMKLTGPAVGVAVVGFLLVANAGTMVVQVYVASVVVQQVRVLAVLPWNWIVALTLVPGILVAFRTQWLLAHVMTWLAYNGVMFVGLAGVMIADFFLLRRLRLRVAHLFARSHQGAYWYAKGVNWTAMAALTGAAAVYLFLFDPISLHVHPNFRYFGAGIPAVVTAGVGYYIAMKVIGRLSRSGSATTPDSVEHEQVTVGL
jgi:NCS1 family nucleobase:cation symporter-1